MASRNYCANEQQILLSEKTSRLPKRDVVRKNKSVLRAGEAILQLVSQFVRLLRYCAMTAPLQMRSNVAESVCKEKLVCIGARRVPACVCGDTVRLQSFVFDFYFISYCLHTYTSAHTRSSWMEGDPTAVNIVNGCGTGSLCTRLRHPKQGRAKIGQN